MRRAPFLIACLALVACSRAPEVTIHTPPAAAPSSSTPAQAALSSSTAHSATSSAPAPMSLDIAVPFSPQAPFADWGHPYQEACEEMSLIMVARYWRGEPLTREEADTELLRLVTWETEHGYPQDIGIADLARVARDAYGLAGIVETEVTEERIRGHLAAGRPVIVPAAGRDLGNPYFSGEGPWYHMLVIRGYAGGEAITNDPGTKRGESYRYDWSTLLSAVHDWTGVKEEIRSGRAAMFVVTGAVQ